METSPRITLKWSAIDFKLKTLAIRHTVTQYTLNNENVIHAADCTKTQKSKRTLPLIKPLEEMLLLIKEVQIKQMKLCKNTYNQQFIEYIYVNDLGELIQPNYITTAFARMLKKNDMRHIRFHDLRHSCATLLYKSGVSLKQVQEWLGHGGHENTQLTKLLDLRRLNKFSRGAILCKIRLNSFITEKFILRSRLFQKNKAYREKSLANGKLKELVVNNLPDSMKADFETIIQNHSVITSFEAEQTFVDGFKLGARLMMEILQEDK